MPAAPNATRPACSPKHLSPPRRMMDDDDTKEDEGHELLRRRCRVLHLIDSAIVMVAAGAAGRYATARGPAAGACPP